MSYEIRREHGYYQLTINREFYGNYDTFGEAMRDLDEEMAARRIERIEGEGY